MRRRDGLRVFIIIDIYDGGGDYFDRIYYFIRILVWCGLSSCATHLIRWFTKKVHKPFNSLTVRLRIFELTLLDSFSYKNVLTDWGFIYFNSKKWCDCTLIGRYIYCRDISFKNIGFYVQIIRLKSIADETVSGWLVVVWECYWIIMSFIYSYGLPFGWLRFLVTYKCRLTVFDLVSFIRVFYTFLIFYYD